VNRDPAPGSQTSSNREPAASRRSRPSRTRRAAWIGIPAVVLAMVGAACGSSGGPSGASAGGPSGGSPTGGSGSSAVTSTGGPAFSTTLSWGPTSWSYNPYVPASTGSVFTGIGIQLGCASMSAPTTNRNEMFVDQLDLCTSYTLSKSNLMTLHLVHNAKFSDGEPITSQTAVDGELLDGITQDNTFENNIEKVWAVNKYTVDIQWTKSTPSIISRGRLQPNNIQFLPPSQYGQFLPKGIANTLYQYNSILRNPKTAKTAQSTPQYKRIEALYKKLIAYKPPTLIGDGPFELKGVTIGQATEVKSPTYFDAKDIHVNRLDIINTVTNSSQVYPLLFSHKLDYYTSTGSTTTTATPAPQMDTFKRTPGAHADLVNTDNTETLLFNNKQYPFTLTPVRQAMAYLINRTTVAKTEDGGALVGNTPTKTPDGYSQLMNSTWLTASQLARLNPYNHDPAKAASLLTSAGFKKVGGHWVMPNGKRFTTSVTAPASATGPLVSKEVAAELTSFGISASAQVVPTASFGADIPKGQFQIAYEDGGFNQQDPICSLSLSAAFGQNETVSGNGAFTAGEPGMGFPMNFKVPGLGTVKDIPFTIENQCQDTEPGPKMTQLAWDWAQLVDQQMPYLTFDNVRTVVLYSTQNFTDYPPANNLYWQDSSIYPTQSLMEMIDHGYIRPS